MYLGGEIGYEIKVKDKKNLTSYAINGLGRIGKLILRPLLESGAKIAFINDAVGNPAMKDQRGEGEERKRERQSGEGGEEEDEERGNTKKGMISCGTDKGSSSDSGETIKPRDQQNYFSKFVPSCTGSTASHTCTFVALKLFCIPTLSSYFLLLVQFCHSWSRLVKIQVEASRFHQEQTVKWRWGRV